MIIELYKIAQEATEKTTDRRNQANRFFITIISLLITFVSLDCSTAVTFGCWFPQVILGLGFILSIVWWYYIDNFKKLLSIKFQILEEMEEKFPPNGYMYYKAENYKNEHYKGNTTKKNFITFSQIEQFLPVLFGTAFALLFISSFFLR